MRDRFEDVEGRLIAVADLPTWRIQEHLQEREFTVYGDATYENVLERLRIELVARKIESRL